MSKSAPPKTKKLYWDACVFLSLIEGHPERTPVLESILDDLDKGLVEIHTSALSIAEVAFAKAEKDGKALDSATEAKIDKLWQPPAPFRLTDVYRAITHDAKAMVRKALGAGVSLKPPDAIHLATAKRIGATVFQTYDEFRGKALEISQIAGIKIEAPAVKGKIVWGAKKGSASTPAAPTSEEASPTAAASTPATVKPKKPRRAKK